MISVSRTETLKVSIPPAPPGFPSLVRERIRDLGPGERVDRDRLEEVCGTASAANQFLHKAARNGLLVPVDWGLYEVADAETLHVLARVAHPVYRVFVAWSRVLPRCAKGRVLFAAPRIWRDTEINLETPMPVLALDPDQREVSGAPPQWDAFHMDVGAPERWRLALDGDVVQTVDVPGVQDLVVLLGAGLAAADPRWGEAKDRLEELLPNDAADHADRELRSVLLGRAPRGRETERVGAGPPQRRRVLAPPWYMDTVERRVGRMARELERLRQETRGSS